ncbi:MAG: hypothetical protein ACLQVF_23540 [Isosphaeraceae bacterium]
MQNTSEGPLFSEADDRLPIWAFRSNGWEIASLAPPFEVDPASALAGLEQDTQTWYETHVLAGPGGEIYTVSGTNGEGRRTTAHRVHGKPERLGRESSSLDPSSCFITGDGTLWNANYTDLKRFDNGRWKTVFQWPQPEKPSRLIEQGRGITAIQWPRVERPSRLNPLKTTGPPWLLLGRFPHGLWQLRHGAHGDDPRLTRVEIRGGTRSTPWYPTRAMKTVSSLRSAREESCSFGRCTSRDDISPLLTRNPGRSTLELVRRAQVGPDSARSRRPHPATSRGGGAFLFTPLTGLRSDFT